VVNVISCPEVVYRVGRTFILHVYICFHILGSHNRILQVCFSLYPGDCLTIHKTAVGVIQTCLDRLRGQCTRLQLESYEHVLTD